MSKVEVIRDVNTPINKIVDNIKTNIRRGLPQFQPHEDCDKTIMIVCGGPSLKDFEEEIIQKSADGIPVVSTNATHDWLIEKGVIPSLHIQLDARPFNKRFVKNWNPNVKYFIASQSDPSVFDTLKGADIRVFHCVGKKEEIIELNKYYFGEYFAVPGGGTIGLRSMMLIRMLGFHKIEMYGFDSCYLDDEHHAYDQKENGIEPVGEFEYGDKTFKCEPWMFEQAQDFCKMIEHLDEKFNLVVHGDGLIAHIIKTGAKLEGELNGS